MSGLGLQVLLFGRFRELAGWSARTLDPSPAQVGDLIAILANEAPELGAALTGAGVKIAADHAYVSAEASLDGVEELAFMPPLSGG